jgi:hypothetical protein
MEIPEEMKRWAAVQFALDERLGIPLPSFGRPWDDMSLPEQAAVLEAWEMIRGRIPDRVLRLEEQIRAKQSRLFEEDDFAASCLLNAEIAELASRINDLHIWYRTQQDLDEEARRHG